MPSEPTAANRRLRATDPSLSDIPLNVRIAGDIRDAQDAAQNLGESTLLDDAQALQVAAAHIESTYPGMAALLRRCATRLYKQAATCLPVPEEEVVMAHSSIERGPFISFHRGPSVCWFKTWRNAGRLTVWTRFFSFSIGRRGPLHDGWPE